MPGTALLRMEGITKSFPGVIANDGVDFEVAAGEVHALLGENGSGKTTLMNVLYGMYRPDAGRIVLRGEEIQLHFGIFGPDDDLRACVVARPLSPREARIRQMAVSPAHQRIGLGRRLMAGVEDILKARGFERIVLDARTSAAGFYERLGYVSAEDEFVKLGVPHVKMSKDLR